MPKTTTDFGYTLVMHSGGGYAGKPGFKRAVEERAIPSQSVLTKIVDAGALVLADYNAAADRAELENYPSNVTGIYPSVRGRFSSITVDGLRVYLPPSDGSLEYVGHINGWDKEGASCASSSAPVVSAPSRRPAGVKPASASSTPARFHDR